MRVAALTRGFSSGVYRRAGDEFDCLAKDFVPSWMIDLGKPGATKPIIDRTKYAPLEIPSLMNKKIKPKSKKAKVKKEEVEQKQD